MNKVSSFLLLILSYFSSCLDPDARAFKRYDEASKEAMTHYFREDDPGKERALIKYISFLEDELKKQELNSPTTLLMSKATSNERLARVHIRQGNLESANACRKWIVENYQQLCDTPDSITWMVNRLNETSKDLEPIQKPIETGFFAYYCAPPTEGKPGAPQLFAPFRIDVSSNLVHSLEPLDFGNYAIHPETELFHQILDAVRSCEFLTPDCEYVHKTVPHGMEATLFCYDVSLDNYQCSEDFVVNWTDLEQVHAHNQFLSDLSRMLKSYDDVSTGTIATNIVLDAKTWNHSIDWESVMATEAPEQSVQICLTNAGPEPYPLRFPRELQSRSIVEFHDGKRWQPHDWHKDEFEISANGSVFIKMTRGQKKR